MVLREDTEADPGIGKREELGKRIREYPEMARRESPRMKRKIEPSMVKRIDPEADP